jgi:dienelactone hydrolase
MDSNSRLSPRRRSCASSLLGLMAAAALVAVGCGADADLRNGLAPGAGGNGAGIGGQGGVAGPGGPNVPGPGSGGGSGAGPQAAALVLAVGMSPLDAVMKAPFELTVEIRDRSGNVVSADSSTAVTVKLATGAGRLAGTLVRTAVAGVVRFDDLEYDLWESVTLEVTAAGLAPVTTGAIPVRPLLRFKDPPAFSARRQTSIGPIVVELADGAGAPVPAKPDQKIRAELPAGGTATGGVERPLTAGRATFEGLVFATAGRFTVTWRSEDLQPLSQAVLVFDSARTEALWLPAGRVGVAYKAALPAGSSGYQLSAGLLPAGLQLDPATGVIAGMPSEARHARMTLVGQAAGVATLWLTDLSIFPENEAPPRPLEQMNVDGPFTVGSHDDQVMVASRNRTAKLRIYYPQTDGKLAEGKFPLVVFHHGAANLAGPATGPFATIYLRFDPLLKRWASHGFVVATIDGVDLIIGGNPARGTTLSLMNLTGMSENQRATISYLKTRNEDPAWPLARHIDAERVVVAGHSRGGGAALITAAAEPEVMAAILLKPIDPLMAPGGEVMWNRKLPARPMLINIAGSDGDVTYPISDFLYERRASAQSAHTIVGSVHNYTLGCTDPRICGPEMGAMPRITREQDWAITNAYATAFLKYVAQGDLGYAALLFGRPGLSTTLSPLGVLMRGDRAAAPVVVDDFQDADANQNSLGQATTGVGFSQSVDEPSMKSYVDRLPGASRARALYGRPATLAFSGAHKLAWTAAGASYETRLGSLDVRGRGAFVLRARSDAGKIAGNQIELTFADAAGKTATVPGTDLVGTNGLNARFSDLIVAVPALKTAGVDTATLAAIRLKVTAPTGTVLIDDLRFE